MIRIMEMDMEQVMEKLLPIVIIQNLMPMKNIMIRPQFIESKMFMTMDMNMVVITTESIYYINYKISHGLPYTERLSVL